MNAGLTLLIIVLAVLVMVLTLLVIGLGKDIKKLLRKKDEDSE